MFNMVVLDTNGKWLVGKTFPGRHLQSS